MDKIAKIVGKRTFRFDAGMDMSVTIEVDLDVLTVDMATAIDEFWAEADEVLAEINGFGAAADDVLGASDGDVIVAATRRAATRLLSTLIDGYTGEWAVTQLCESEGWPPKEQLGMRVVDFELPDLRSAALKFTEIGSAA